MIDLHPAAERVARIAAELTDDQLALATPCGDATVGDLIDHLGMFARNFRRVAGKELDETTSVPPRAFDAANLGPAWRDQLTAELAALAEAWASKAAWDGSTWVGGMHLPAEVVGVIALDELVVHGWDLAASTGRPFEPPAHEVAAATAFVAGFDAPRDGRLFGPVVDVSPDAAALDRLLGLAGRDPRWRPTR